MLERASAVTDAQGGGSQIAVMPAAPISAARPATTAYQGGCGRCTHSQLKPCEGGLLGSVSKLVRVCDLVERRLHIQKWPPWGTT